jgi:hypothetical protein
MRCREARLRLDAFRWKPDGLAEDQELLEHLKHCPACARQAQAARELRQAFSALAAEKADDAITWSEQIRRVEAQVALRAPTHHKEYSIMSALKESFRKRPRLGIGLAAALAILLAATLIPMKFDQTVGFEVAVAGVSPDLAFDTGRINDLLSRLGVQNATVDVTGCEQTCNLKIASLTSPEDAEMVKVAFEELSKGANMKQIVIELNTVTEEVSTSALGHVTKTFIVKSFDNPDEYNFEVQELVSDKLKDVDCNMFFFCDSTVDGMQQITITGVGDCGDMQWTDAGSGDVNFSSDDFQWVDEDGNVTQKKMMIVGTADGDFSGCMIQPSQIVDGHLTAEARTALEAQGFTVEESVDNDGGTVVRLSRTVGGDEQVVELKLSSIEEGQVDEAAKDVEESSLPDGYSLSQNYPNPFNPTTQFDFSLPSTEHVTVEIYNINGQKVRTLVDQTYGPGTYTIEWDATSDNGQPVASGVYLYRFTAGDVTQTRKMSFVK